MALASGTRLGAYEILTLIGSGGMGEVYRARDTRLGRDVAIKVLPGDVAADPDRLARFEREAQVLASLNHPNIAQIYGVEDSGGKPALVMELVEGPTLADRIARAPIPLDEALPIAGQIAEALEAAHEQGIIHRDLKPANIKVRPDGTVKVLDFGLAKAFEPVAAAVGNATMSPTLSIHATQAGLILGTAAYMSPEQARGKPVDKRADIWSFGCVLYEMLTGARAFGGDDISMTLAAVLQSDPDWSALPRSVPPVLSRMLRRCLQRDPRDRLRDIGEARIAIAERLHGGASDLLERPPAARARLGWWIPAATLIGGGAMAAAVLAFYRPSIGSARVARFDVTPPSASAIALGVSRNIAITPDGSHIVYVGTNATALFVRSLDQLDPVPLVRGASPRDPFISPDGQWVGFFDGGFALKKVPLAGGPVVTIARFDSFERGGAWADDGTIVFATQSVTVGLRRVSANGGPITVLTRPDANTGEGGHAWPETLPGSQGVLYTVISAKGGLDGASIALFDARSGRSTTLLRGGYHAQYSTSGYLTYGAAGSLRAVRFDLGRSSAVGESAIVLPNVRTTVFGAVDAAMARDGTLLFVSGGTESGATRTLVWIDRSGVETPTAAPSGAYYFPRVSPDGSQLAINAVVDANSDIWLWNVARTTLTRVTTDQATDAFYAWAPDGRHIVFSSNRTGPFNLYRQAVDGSGSVERLTESASSQAPTDVLRDGGVVFVETSTTTGEDVLLWRADGPRRVVPLVQTPFDERNGTVSPDRRWLAYEANDSGAFEIYVRPFPDVSTERWLVSTRGGTQPLWSPRGRELFYVAPDGALMRVDVADGPAWTASPPAKALDAHTVVSTGGNTLRNYDISPDGRRFLVLKETSGDENTPPARMIVTEHFDQELKRLVR